MKKKKIHAEKVKVFEFIKVTIFLRTANLFKRNRDNERSEKKKKIDLTKHIEMCERMLQ